MKQDVVSKDLPRHIAIIMDGNGRWAKSRNLPRYQGHLEGVKRVEEIIETASQMGIKVLTLYTFSTENWNRPQAEIAMLMKTLCAVLNKKAAALQKENIKLNCIGRRQGVSQEVLKTFARVMKLTKDNSGLVLNIAFNYGSRVEIVDAVKGIAAAVLEGRLAVDNIDEETFSRHLYTSNLPDPDLLIRTSGEMRISNFLLWQLSYAELYFTDKFWPDFDSKEFKKAILEYQKRERRYGQVTAP